jgi:DNA repair protein RecO (recombination protein O)
MAHQITRCFILHSRPFKETSLLLDIISQSNGRFSIVAKGAKRKNSQSLRAILQPFNELELTFTGRSDLKTLVNAELFLEASPQSEPTDCTAEELAIRTKSPIVSMPSRVLACGYYINELMIRSLSASEPCPELWERYRECLNDLRREEPMSATLRQFEVSLLEDLGISPDWTHDINGQAIEEDTHYYFIEEQGFCPVSQSEQGPEQSIVNSVSQGFKSNAANQFIGAAILAIGKAKYSTNLDKYCQQITQRLLRQVIGQKPLESRKLWV